MVWESTVMDADKPGARRYNTIKRWLGIADFVLGLGMLVLLVATGWSGGLRDAAYRVASQNYTLAVFFFVLMLLLLGKLLGLGLDFYGFRLEHRFQLSNQKPRAWARDEAKGFLLELMLATFVAGALSFMIRTFPQHCW